MLGILPSHPSWALVPRLLMALSLLLLARHAHADDVAMNFHQVDPGGLSVWDAGRMRLRLALQVDSCVRQVAGRSRPEGELVVTLPVASAGKAPRARVTTAARRLRRTAACLQRALRSKVSFVEAPADYVWSATVRLGEIPAGISISILRLESADLMNRAIFQSVFTLQLERADCVARTLDAGLSAAIEAKLALSPGRPATASVTMSTHASASLVPCLEQALTDIVLPAGSVPAEVRLFFHLLQPAPPPSGQEPTLTLSGPDQ